MRMLACRLFFLTSYPAILEYFICLQELEVCPCYTKIRSGPALFPEFPGEEGALLIGRVVHSGSGRSGAGALEGLLLPQHPLEMPPAVCAVGADELACVLLLDSLEVLRCELEVSQLSAEVAMVSLYVLGGEASPLALEADASALETACVF